MVRLYSSPPLPVASSKWRSRHIAPSGRIDRLSDRSFTLAIHCWAYWPTFAAQGRKGAAEFPGASADDIFPPPQRQYGRPMRPEPRMPSDVHRLEMSMARVSVAWLMSEDHRADRKDGGADPNKNGGFLLGNEWRRFHDRINRTVNNSSYSE
jgi:hypothetical protein